MIQQKILEIEANWSYLEQNPHNQHELTFTK